MNVTRLVWHRTAWRGSQSGEASAASHAVQAQRNGSGPVRFGAPAATAAFTAAPPPVAPRGAPHELIERGQLPESGGGETFPNVDRLVPEGEEIPAVILNGRMEPAKIEVTSVAGSSQIPPFDSTVGSLVRSTDPLQGVYSWVRTEWIRHRDGCLWVVLTQVLCQASTGLRRSPETSRHPQEKC
jgi:hypothetical protein